jgi:hypothetical protein
VAIELICVLVSELEKMATPPIFADLFSYGTMDLRKYPSTTTLNFSRPVLLRDVQVALGKVTAILPKGTKLESAIWVSGSRLELKCSFGTRVPLAERPEYYEQLLRKIGTEGVDSKTVQTA